MKERALLVLCVAVVALYTLRLDALTTAVSAFVVFALLECTERKKQ